MDVGKGWGKGTGDALPSAPQQQPAPARAEGSSTGLQSWMERGYRRAVNLPVITLSPPSRSVGAQPAAVAAPGCGPGVVLVHPWGGQGILNLNGFPNPHGR